MVVDVRVRYVVWHTWEVVPAKAPDLAISIAYTSVFKTACEMFYVE